MPSSKPLDFTYAVIAGDKLLRLVQAYHTERLTTPSLPWPDDFQDAFQTFSARHSDLKTTVATSKDVPLRIIDYAEDRVLGGLHSLLSALQQIFAQPPLDLSAEQAALASDAALLLGEFFPQGIRPIIHADYQSQWVQVDSLLQKSRDLPSCREASERLNLTPILAWLALLHQTYGAKLGITGEQQSTEQIQALVSWHESYDELLLVASYHQRRGSKTPRLLALVEPPYLEEMQRQASDRAALRTKKPSPPAPSQPS